MKIVRADELRSCGVGTVYVQWEPSMYTGEPCVITEMRGENSWWSTDVLPWVDGCDDKETNQELEYLNAGEEIIGAEFTTDDAPYDYDDGALFVVFSKDEVKQMINVLLKAL